ncbi:MAG: hypothetical protein IPG63_16310 [Xanthomonadales bacterium]|nr:hypothetical protein [Xanthomonadales bacterium]MBK7147109.1 hypothetical protein [Xanthomonadales bacterium]MCC6560983.1 hypothetical protein [Xanthomonadales bacterium]
MRSAPSLSFEASPSRIAGALTLCITLMAMLAVAASGLASSAKLVLLALIVLAGSLQLRLRRGDPGPRCTLQSEGDWLLVLGTDETRAELQRSHDLGFLIALQFRSDGGRRIDLALWHDSIPAETRRRLRVWLGRKGGLH